MNSPIGSGETLIGVFFAPLILFVSALFAGFLANSMVRDFLGFDLFEDQEINNVYQYMLSDEQRPLGEFDFNLYQSIMRK